MVYARSAVETLTLTATLKGKSFQPEPIRLCMAAWALLLATIVNAGHVAQRIMGRIWQFFEQGPMDGEDRRIME